ncbi:ABC transporter substrate-binding protein [Oceanibacterium hippocampi]|uniref:Dipeptide-binding protein DppE n=1 Tax=Oceanibacterium hippocampi TaxID=745714 RepID=A0A1Y5TM43_9PROT|nr:ABC transporter substrate-binding protein [Oceanibacterium hippocampi]SLN63398.1 Dipeptide-binding protein DppE precursor [Oceanibacterium hippocampi]
MRALWKSGGRRLALVAAAVGGVAVGGAGMAQAENVIAWGKAADVTSMDVNIAGTVASWTMYQMIYETLLTTDKDMNLQPGLAVSWEQTSPTGYVLKLRENAKWSNGRPVTAGDVIGSLQRISGEELNPEGVAAATTDEAKQKASLKISSYWGRQFGVIKSMTAPDDHTVVVELEKPHTAFLTALAHISAAIVPIKELKDGTFDPNSEMLGSGPFMVAEHLPKESWTLVRNPHYWRDGYPKADRIDVPIIPDEAARVAALRDGRVDYAIFSNPDIARLVADDPNIVVEAQKTTNYFRVDINALSDKSAFKDKRIRQAFNLAIDRNAIANIVFAGATVPDQPVPVAFGKDACGTTDTYALPREERLKKARELVTATGEDEVETTIIAPASDPVYARIAQVIQQNARDVGIEVEILQMPTAEYLQKVFTDGDFDASISWLAGYSDPSMVIAWWNPKFAVWNTVFHEYVPELADALGELKSTPAGGERDAKLTEVCGMIDDGANILALVSKVDFILHRKDKIDIRVDPVSGSSNTFQYAAEYTSKD